MRHTRFYQIYYRAKNRCENKGNNRYYLYWWRWIRFLWDSFESFRDDMYESYLQHIKDFWEKDTTIERKDNDKDYCKENCKRATNEEQANNQRRIKKIEINWESKSLKQWCRFYNLSYGMVFARISRGANIMSSLNIETIEAAE